MTRPTNLYAESSAILAWLLGEDAVTKPASGCTRHHWCSPPT